ncbi:MAG TPA: Uma2 family endonuclease [Blastocatellia bacterium]|nr:Uma2 family endonuclease [Blastocatellia bacterium]
MGAAQPHLKYTLAEYLAFEEAAAEKHEYWQGQIYAMAGASPVHNQICFNLAAIIGRQIQGGSCCGYSSDQKIWIEAVDVSTYANLTIVCGAPQYHAEYSTLLLNPKVIIEVLSPSTEAYDRGEKWACYQLLDSLTDNLLVSQQRVQIEHYTRKNSSQPWHYFSEIGLQSSLEIASISCLLPLNEVYSGIELPPSSHSRPPIQIVSE